VASRVVARSSGSMPDGSFPSACRARSPSVMAAAPPVSGSRLQGSNRKPGNALAQASPDDLAKSAESPQYVRQVSMSANASKHNHRRSSGVRTHRRRSAGVPGYTFGMKPKDGS
jgi:hypothetical protein